LLAEILFTISSFGENSYSIEIIFAVTYEDTIMPYYPISYKEDIFSNTLYSGKIKNISLKQLINNEWQEYSVVNFYYSDDEPVKSIDYPAKLAKIYPNPCTNYFIVDLDNSERIQVNIYNLDGRLVYSENTKNRTFQINEFKKGYYIVEIKQQEEILGYKKIIKQ